MNITRLHHVTVRCAPDRLAALREFYQQVLGMEAGPRPSFPFPGHWMYVGEVALVHLAAILPDDATNGGTATAGFDHVSFHARDLAGTRARLAGQSIPFEELPVPGWPLHQIFLRDPVGSKIELTFEVPQ